MPVRHATARVLARIASPLLVAIAGSVSSAGAQVTEGQVKEMDNAIFWFARAELDATQSPGPVVGSWDGVGWIGTDRDRLWWRTFGERADGAFTEGELTLLYGRYVRMFWDLVAGVRYEFEPVGSGFFTAGIQTSSGDGLSNTSVKDMIAEIFKNEDTSKPLSDQEVVKMLKDKGIVIARRTVAKYRTELNILPSNLRKVY